MLLYIFSLIFKLLNFDCSLCKMGKNKLKNIFCSIISFQYKFPKGILKKKNALRIKPNSAHGLYRLHNPATVWPSHPSPALATWISSVQLTKRFPTPRTLALLLLFSIKLFPRLYPLHILSHVTSRDLSRLQPLFILFPGPCLFPFQHLPWTVCFCY